MLARHPPRRAGRYCIVLTLLACANGRQALAAIEEAVAVRRDLAAARPDAFRPDPASSLANLSNRLAALGRRKEALAAIEEAAGVYRDLAAASPDAFRVLRSRHPPGDVALCLTCLLPVG